MPDNDDLRTRIEAADQSALKLADDRQRSTLGLWLEFARLWQAQGNRDRASAWLSAAEEQLGTEPQAAE